MVFGDLRSDVAIYAICGMVAVASAVIGAPLATILIVFELTRNYDLATAAMVSVVFSNLVSYRMFGRSFFDVQLNMRGLDLSLGRDRAMIDSMTIGDHVSRDFTGLDSGMSPKAAIASLLASHRHEGYVLDGTGTLLGKVRLEDLMVREQESGASTAVVADMAQKDTLVLSSGMSIWEAIERTRGFPGESIPVVCGDEPETMVGVVFEATLVRAYLDMSARNRREEHAS